MKDYTGIIFTGNQTAIRFEKRIKKATYWVFRCECGIERSFSIDNARNGNMAKCKCKKIDFYQSVVYKYSVLYIIRYYKKSALKRNIVYDISECFVSKILKENCHYCGVPPYKEKRPLTNPVFLYNGIDRKDNDIGYIEENCLPCCEICNKAKRHLSYYDFIAWIEKIKKHSIL